MLTSKLVRHNVPFNGKKTFRDSLPMANAIFGVICHSEPPERDGFVKGDGDSERKTLKGGNM